MFGKMDAKNKRAVHRFLKDVTHFCAEDFGLQAMKNMVEKLDYPCEKRFFQAAIQGNLNERYAVL